VAQSTQCMLAVIYLIGSHDLRSAYNNDHELMSTLHDMVNFLTPAITLTRTYNVS
jgi:hypothetical protein